MIWGQASSAGKVASLQKREQLKAEQAENPAAIGRSLSAVAHDMKTPLIAIGGFANLIEKHFLPGNPDCNKLDIIVGETARLEGMVKNTLDFSRPLELIRRYVQGCRNAKERGNDSPQSPGSARRTRACACGRALAPRGAWRSAGGRRRKRHREPDGGPDMESGDGGVGVGGTAAPNVFKRF